MANRRCPCGTGLPYDECCGPLHAGATPAATAEQLMRSRYSAFAVGDAAYLLATWHPSTRPPALELDPGVRWEPRVITFCCCVSVLGIRYRPPVCFRCVGGPVGTL